MIVYIWRRDR